MVSSRTPSRKGRSTLVSASTLWGSHFSQNQNQFHPGPRRNVPMMISDTQTMCRIITPQAIRNSLRTRWGQVWILSSPGPVAFLIGTSICLAPDGTAFKGVAMASSGVLALGAPTCRPEEGNNDQDEDERDGQHAAAREDERQRDQDDGADDALQLRWHPSYRAGPENPSRRMRQKWTAMNRLATSGLK